MTTSTVPDLRYTQIFDHQSNLPQAGYENRNIDCFHAVWALWDRGDITARFETARRVSITLDGASV